MDNGYFLLFKEMKFDWRYFMIKKTQINEGLLLYCIIYLCSFNFWDTKFGMLFKYFFFCVILIGLIGYGKRLLVNKGKIQTTAKTV